MSREVDRAASLSPSTRIHESLLPLFTLTTRKTLGYVYTMVYNTCFIDIMFNHIYKEGFQGSEEHCAIS